MKMVIDIPEEMYEEICPIEYSVYGLSSVKNKQLFYQLVYAIQKGTPLPEHHGDLIDRDELLIWSHKIDTMYCIYDEVVDVGDVINAPTVIEKSDNEWVEKKPQKDTKTYICDPEKNTECKKTHCQTLCFKTTEPRYRKTDGERSESE